MNIWLYSLGSVFIVSLISLIGLFSIPINEKRLKDILIYFISFSAGALLGDTFIHLLPEAVYDNGLTLPISLYILSGIGASFLMEKIICWRHCHLPITKTHIHRFAYMSIVGDAIHNFIDGMIIGAAYLVNIPVGIATTVAIILHEIPQEVGDFAILIHGGFTKKKALVFNFLIALTAVLGTVITLVLGTYLKNIEIFLVPFAAGTFIYIASSDLIPELHKETETKKNLIQFIAFVFGIIIMLSLLTIG